MKTSTPKGKSNSEYQAAQELKAQQEFKHHTHQSLNKIQNEIESLWEQNRLTLSKSESNWKNLLIEMENLNDWILSSFKIMSQKIGDFESSMLNMRNDVSEFMQEVRDLGCTKEELEKSSEFLDQTIISNHLKNVYNQNSLLHDLENLKGQIKQGLDSLRKELSVQEPEIDPIKQQIDERLKVFQVDFDGLVKEIAILKKSSVYSEKKFENIYTLIERLKEGKQ